jgi:choline dehydrogenase-like flavoprotein
MLRLSFSTEMLPEPSNHIELSTKTDVLGIPRPLFTFDVGDYVRQALREGYETAKELFAAMEATLVGEPSMPDGKWNTAAHIMGTCIMGDDPKNSVVNRWGRAHDVPNLWIVGSSVFATSATANPTLTLAALSLRTAAAIHRG